MKLYDLGFEKWFEAHATEFLREDGSIARVSAVDRGSYLIRNESGEVPAEADREAFLHDWQSR